MTFQMLGPGEISIDASPGPQSFSRPRCQYPKCGRFVKLTDRGRPRTYKFCSHKCCQANKKGKGKCPYIQIRVNGKIVLEHRYIMEQILGRPLTDEEVVHHKNHKKKDNAPSNLQLFATQAEHAEHMAHHGHTSHWDSWHDTPIERTDDMPDWVY